MSPLKSLFLFISLLGPLNATWAAAKSAQFGNSSKGSTFRFGAATEVRPLRKDHLRIFVWNIHKGEDKRLPQDFAELAAGADLALFEESVSTKSFIKAIAAANPEMGWTMAKSFQMLNFAYTGVATGSRVKALRDEVIVSAVTEPITSTPKTILISEFALENSTETLLLANVHGINFVSAETYKVQMQQLLEKICDHKGPLIVAGDFNTWDSDRITLLRTLFAPLGLQMMPTPVEGLLSLDRIYVRGLTPVYVYDYSNVDSSDHAPLMVDLIFKDTSGDKL